MTKKACIKRASKQWPKTDRSDRLDRAIALVNEYEGSDDIRKERDITPKVQTINEQQLHNLKTAIEFAGLTVAKFCDHKSIKIDCLESLPDAKYEGAMNWLKSILTGEKQ